MTPADRLALRLVYPGRQVDDVTERSRQWAHDNLPKRVAGAADGLVVLRRWSGNPPEGASLRAGARAQLAWRPFYPSAVSTKRMALGVRLAHALLGLLPANARGGQFDVGYGWLQGVLFGSARKGGNGARLEAALAALPGDLMRAERVGNRVEVAVYLPVAADRTGPEIDLNAARDLPPTLYRLYLGLRTLIHLPGRTRNPGRQGKAWFWRRALHLYPRISAAGLARMARPAGARRGVLDLLDDVPGIRFGREEAALGFPVYPQEIADGYGRGDPHLPGAERPFEHEVRPFEHEKRPFEHERPNKPRKPGGLVRYETRDVVGAAGVGAAAAAALCKRTA